jgi:hypothetical protein
MKNYFSTFIFLAILIVFIISILVFKKWKIIGSESFIEGLDVNEPIKIDTNNNTLVYTYYFVLYKTKIPINMKINLNTGTYTWLSFKKEFENKMKLLKISIDNNTDKITIDSKHKFKIYGTNSTIAPLLGIPATTLESSTNEPFKIFLPNPFNKLSIKNTMMPTTMMPTTRMPTTMMPTPNSKKNFYIFKPDELRSYNEISKIFALKNIFPNFISRKILSFSISVNVNNISGIDKFGSQIFRITTNDILTNNNSFGEFGERVPAFFIEKTDPTKPNALTCIYANNTGNPDYYEKTNEDFTNSILKLQGVIDYNDSSIEYYIVKSGTTIPLNIITDLYDMSKSVELLNIEIFNQRKNGGFNGGIFINEFIIYDYKYNFFNLFTT